jgi:D-alanyl-D-alanine carboxypeptidase/D-alanyl-D-alanine-endopeptidase (penicillin-binding protein 4)
MDKMFRIFFFISAIILNINCASQIKSCSDILVEFTGHNSLKNASISIYAENLSKNKIILEHNSTQSLVPASVFKIIPTAIALELFGNEHKFKTELAYSGEILSDGTLNGDIYIIGYGDPCLGSENFSNYYNNGKLLEQWVLEISKLGIKNINGNIISDASYFGEIQIPNKWIWEDIANYYGHQGSTLNYFDNLYKLHFLTGATDGSETLIKNIEPNDLEINFINEVKSSTSSGDEAYIYLGDNNSERIVRGTLPCKRTNYIIKGSLPSPELYLAKTLKKYLNNNKINISGEYTAIYKSDNKRKNVFHTVFSPTLYEIVTQTNIKSNNLYAEVLSLHIAKKTDKSYKNAVIDFLKSKNIDADGLNIEDASGLSHFNTANSKQIVLLLKYLKQTSSQRRYFFNSLPISGINSESFSNTDKLKNKIHAKSGSMTRVRAYAGYMYTNSGDEIVFCFIVNNYNCKDYQMKKLYDDFFYKISKVQ